ncbi:hypothetical protein [Nocardia sp. BMG111209]|uniref:hypothetical protein n=1 Tax=Nocardia sp. BMG111209 TaxID=1160137 RepID=UPI000382E6D3|nr:hypothetical protein [Nocardia sp. BMG111209]
MSEFYVEDIFPVSFRPTPFVVGSATGDFTVGQHVELRKKNGSVFRGVLESLDFHQPEPGKFSLVFSEEISSHLEPGDIVHSLSAGDSAAAENGTA